MGGWGGSMFGVSFILARPDRRTLSFLLMKQKYFSPIRFFAFFFFTAVRDFFVLLFPHRSRQKRKRAKRGEKAWQVQTALSNRRHSAAIVTGIAAPRFVPIATDIRNSRLENDRCKPPQVTGEIPRPWWQEFPHLDLYLLPPRLGIPV